MNFFAPERPKASNGTPQILVDGSVLPLVQVWPVSSSEVRLGVVLREYESGENFSYVHKTKIIALSEIPLVMMHYIEDPENMLEFYFGWQPQPRFKSKPTAKAAKPTVYLPPEPENSAFNLDLI